MQQESQNSKLMKTSINVIQSEKRYTMSAILKIEIPQGTIEVSKTGFIQCRMSEKLVRHYVGLKFSVIEKNLPFHTMPDPVPILELIGGYRKFP